MSKVKTGTVISTKMLKTVVVEIKLQIKHPLYKKAITRTRNFKAHDEIGVQIGQKVKIAETKPYSKSVHYKVLEVIK